MSTCCRVKGLGLRLDGVPRPINKFLCLVAFVVCLVKRRKIIGKEEYQTNGPNLATKCREVRHE